MVLYNGADFDIQTTFTLVVLELIINRIKDRGLNTILKNRCNVAPIFQ